MGHQDKVTWNGNSEIFKTYVKGRGKRPVEKVKDRDQISTFPEVCGCESFGAILNPGWIDISFDTKDMYAAFLKMAEANEWKCMALPSSKGGHTYWKCTRRYVKSGEDKTLTVGLVADIHSGSTYIPLKVDGVERFPPDYDTGEYQEVPDELLPIETTVKLWKMEDGQGRNQETFRYIRRLQAVYRFSQDTIVRILQNANRYILADPLPLTEFDTIMRDESFEKPVFWDGAKFLHDVFAAWLIENCKVVLINRQLHIYKDGVYVPGATDLERAMVAEIPFLKKSQRREVTETLLLTAEEKKVADARYIAFNNGILDIVANRMLPFSPDLVVTNRIPWDYQPDAESELVDKTFDRIACGDSDIRALLEECIGYCFFRRNELRKAFILTGGRRGGKSTYLDCIKTILGDDNISSLDLKEVGDRFSTAMMFGKLANIGDDIGDDFLMGSQVAIFKKIVGGNRIKAERKGYDPFDFNPYVKLMFSANEIPRMRDRGGAVLDRLIIIPFNAFFDKGQPDYEPFLKYRLIEKEPIEYMIKLGVIGLQRVLADDRGFTQSTAVQQQLEEYNEANNPVLGFLRETDLEEDILNVPTRDVYRKYTVFCAENGFNAVGHTVFSRQLARMLKLSTRVVRTGNKTVRVFEKQQIVTDVTDNVTDNVTDKGG